mmetsp:Transcript_4648/g.6045  ORF Transcript_4648/g.6045 Transcript_4648/m.6045 type:complete len:311 (-) Transcript_4648:183-1115(-)
MNRILLYSRLLTLFSLLHEAFPFVNPIPFKSCKQIKLNVQHLSSSTASSLSAAVTIAEGLSKTTIQNGDSTRPVRLGDIATVSYNCYIPSNNNKIIAKSSSQKVVVGDGIMVEGWELGLASMKVGERSIIHVQDSMKYGYGSDGIPPILGPNENIEIDMEVLDSEAQTTMGNDVDSVSAISGMTGSGELGALDPMKPRTPEAISAAYKVRQEQMAIEKANEKEGLEGWIEKAKEFYFFGFFEGETGEEAPWILRPSITFPIAFAIVGLGFWITYAVGGISERGAQRKDELDDIVLAYNVIKSSVTVALVK